MNSSDDRQHLIIWGSLTVILALGAFLRLYQLGAAGIGNPYYAAAVKSMLLSWKNFFYVAFEPGGSLSLDKPPLGFWIQAIPAYFFGLSGFALALPNALAGIFSIFVLYQLSQRSFGPWIGLIAALALAVTPVAISAERNNTPDGLLALVLLLATWACLQSIHTGKLRWLLLSVALIGLGFNIKMLQAYLPLPAFYATYFFGAPQAWKKKIQHLAAATLVLVAISLSWALIVDLTPASARPYVDSTANNSALELIVGHNGFERLAHPNPPSPSQPGTASLNGSPWPPPNASVDFGTPGVFRLFSAPLAGEAAWLLPFLLGGLPLLIIQLWRRPPTEQRTQLILWTSWLLPVMLFFSFSTGILHAYYLLMLAAPLAALTALTAWGFWKLLNQHPKLSWGLFALLMFITLVIQGVTVWRESIHAIWALAFASLLLIGGLIVAVASRQRIKFKLVAYILSLASIFVAPATWSVLTTLNTTPSPVLPYAGPTRPIPTGLGSARPTAPLPPNTSDSDSQNLLSFLLANTPPNTYLLATGRITRAADYILQTGRPVLPIGGFLGQYQVVNVDQLAALVSSGQLRFVLAEDLDQQPAIAQWAAQNCTPIEPLKLAASNSSVKQPPPPTLYDCAK